MDLDLTKLKQEIDTRKTKVTEDIEASGKGRYSILESLMQSRQTGGVNEATNHIKQVINTVDSKDGGNKNLSKSNDGLTNNMLQHTKQNNNTKKPSNDLSTMNEQVKMDPERDNNLYAEIERRQKEYMSHGAPITEDYTKPPQQYNNNNNPIPANNMDQNKMLKHLEQVSQNYLNDRISELAYQAIKNDIVETYRIETIKKTIKKHPEVFRDIIIDVIKDLSK